MNILNYNTLKNKNLKSKLKKYQYFYLDIANLSNRLKTVYIFFTDAYFIKIVKVHPMASIKYRSLYCIRPE